jgi:hypothetical protein
VLNFYSLLIDLRASKNKTTIFMSKYLKELLLANVHLPMAQQKEVLDSTFANWRGTLEQVDDVCVIGVRF